VCERNAERLARAKGLFPGVAVTEDFDICMGSQGVDAVVVATPPATHASLTLRALAKGKHVFVEKPLALQSSHVRRIEQVAEEQAPSPGLPGPRWPRGAG